MRRHILVWSFFKLIFHFKKRSKRHGISLTENQGSSKSLEIPSIRILKEASSDFSDEKDEGGDKKKAEVPP